MIKLPNSCEFPSNIQMKAFETKETVVFLDDYSGSDPLDIEEKDVELEQIKSLDETNVLEENAMATPPQNLLALQFRSIGYKIMSHVSNDSFRSEYYNYRMSYVDAKRCKQKYQNARENHYENALICTFTNLVVKQSFKKFKEIDFERSQMCKEEDNEYSASTTPQTMIRNGLSMGVHLYIAEEYLIHNKDLEILFSSFSKGFPLQAEQNHVNYQWAMRKVKPPEAAFPQLFLEDIVRNKKNRTNEVLIDLFKYITEERVETFLKDLKAYEKNPLQKFSSGVEKEITTQFLLNNECLKSVRNELIMPALIKEALQNHPSDSGWIVQKSEEGYHLDYPMFKTALINIINKSYKKIIKTGLDEASKAIIEKNRECLLQEIELAISLNECSWDESNPTYPSNPVHKSVFIECYRAYLRVSMDDAAAATVGLVRHSTKLDGLTYSNDSSYIENLVNLKPGFYGINLTTSPGVISLIIKKDVGYIIDYTLGVIKFDCINDCKRLLCKVLERHLSPDDKKTQIANIYELKREEN